MRKRTPAMSKARQTAAAAKATRAATVRANQAAAAAIQQAAVSGSPTLSTLIRQHPAQAQAVAINDMMVWPNVPAGSQNLYNAIQTVAGPNALNQIRSQAQGNQQSGGSFWTGLRDGVEGFGSIIGNFVVPGSGAITGGLVSNGAQQSLTGGTIGALNMGVSGGLGLAAGNPNVVQAISNATSGTPAATATTASPATTTPASTGTGSIFDPNTYLNSPPGGGSLTDAGNTLAQTAGNNNTLLNGGLNDLGAAAGFTGTGAANLANSTPGAYSANALATGIPDTASGIANLANSTPGAYSANALATGVPDAVTGTAAAGLASGGLGGGTGALGAGSLSGLGSALGTGVALGLGGAALAGALGGFGSGMPSTPVASTNAINALANYGTQTNQYLTNTLMPQQQQQLAAFQTQANQLGGQESALANAQAGLSTAAQNQYLNTFAPVNQNIVDTANAANTPAAWDQQASLARGDAATAQAQQMQQMQNQLQSYGVDPSSGRFAGMYNAAAVNNAATQAAAETQARLGAQQLGWNKLLSASQLGSSVGGLANSSAANAGNLGSTAANIYAQPANMSNAFANTDTNMQNAAANMQTQSGNLSNSLYNTQGNMWSAQQQAQATAAAGIGKAIGTGLASPTGQAIASGIGSGIGSLASGIGSGLSNLFSSGG